MRAIPKTAKIHPAAKQCCGWEEPALCYLVVFGVVLFCIVYYYLVLCGLIMFCTVLFGCCILKLYFSLKKNHECRDFAFLVNMGGFFKSQCFF